MVRPVGVQNNAWGRGSSNANNNNIEVSINNNDEEDMLMNNNAGFSNTDHDGGNADLLKLKDITISLDNNLHPLYLHNNDQPRISLIFKKLTGLENYNP